MSPDTTTTAGTLGLFPPGSSLDPDGELVVGGCRLADLAARWGTPLYVVADDAVRSQVHIGSQILDTEPYTRAVEAVAALGDFDVYNLGGGLGVRYTYADC
jgi:diaminopimelate decarboxylase